MSLFETTLRRARRHSRALITLGRETAEIKVLTGGVCAELIAQRGKLKSLSEAEFKVFSQFGEDGIIQYLVRQTGIPPAARSFVEFGVETYEEANTRFLLMKDNWRGLVIDGSESHTSVIRDSSLYWRHSLTALTAFIDRDNINQLISNAGFKGEIGILSVDIDGNDYWVWESISVVDPIIVICEYNSVFGPHQAVSVPYNPSFYRTSAHSSNLYWGCSIAAWEHLARKKGYALVGSNSAGNNAFFVRRDKLNGLDEVPAAQAWVESRFRESRDTSGRPTYIDGKARFNLISAMPVVDVRTGQTRKLGDFNE